MSIPSFRKYGEKVEETFRKQSMSPVTPDYRESKREKAAEKIRLFRHTQREKFKHLLKGVKRKYPKLNVDVSNAKSNYDYSEGMLKFEIVIGGTNSGQW